eukprot:TRINITY_DN13518_c0_g4_i1.p1 TRINITY_DN13518_c0_g4~~TRINITY_DN13518_c0_g4_i1.p1  ORF type:complete len:131 (+),score=28.08 TRINITY_DN13518_c0_g4_i1:85-477(+)
MVSVRLLFMIAILFLLQSTSYASKNGKADGYSYQVLKKQSCKKETAAKKGSSVRMLLSASVDTPDGEMSSDGSAEIKFIVGRHQIPPLNKAVVGMCAGEVRRVHVNSHGIDYTVKLLEVERTPLRVKDAL